MRMRKLLLAALFGAASLLPATVAAQVWEVDNFCLAAPGEHQHAVFGSALAIGDFDGDGVHDVAVGASWWHGPLGTATGGWMVYWGSTSRNLTAAADSYFYDGTTGTLRAGAALAAGDFDGDGRDELAVGAPETGMPGGIEEAGIVIIDEFENGGWVPDRDVFSQGPLPGTDAEDGDLFGSVLASGDFDGDGYDDLAIGSTGEDLTDFLGAGVVHVLYGSSGGLSTAGAVMLFSPGSEIEMGEHFGRSLAVGDFDGDDYDDLAVGIPSRDVGDVLAAGAVKIYFGAAAGIVTPAGQTLFENSFSVGLVEAGDSFGGSLAAGNFNQASLQCLIAGNCYDDLAIGVTGEDATALLDTGKVIVGNGGPSGIETPAGLQFTAASVGSATEEGDQFGSELASGRLDKSSSNRADLAIGTPYEDWASVADDGVVHLLFGASGGLNQGDPYQFVPQRAGMEIAPGEEGDRFGSVLAIGDLDDDGWGDLVVSAPSKYDAAGAVQILWGALFADGFGRGNDDGWTP